MAAFYTPASNAAAGGSLWMEARADGSILTSLWKMSNGATAKMYVPACTARKKKLMRPMGSRVDNYPSGHVVTTMFSLDWLTPKDALKFCAYCYTSNAQKLCSCCGAARYCSRACFSKHWQEHRHVCNWSPKTLLKKIQTFGGADTIIKVGKVRQKLVKYIVQDWAPRLTELVFLCKLGNYDLYMDQSIAAAYTSNLVFGDPTCATMYNAAVTNIADINVFGPVLAKKHVEREQRADPCAICLEELTVGEASTLACGHSFHRDCMSDALKRGHSACPLCRAGLDTTDRGNARKHTDMYTQEHVVARRIMMDDTCIIPSSLNNKSKIKIMKAPMCPGGKTTQPPFYGLDTEKLVPMCQCLKNSPQQNRAIVLVLADEPYLAVITNIQIKGGFDAITIVPPTSSI
jgi:hypothetical protein